MNIKDFFLGLYGLVILGLRFFGITPDTSPDLFYVDKVLLALFGN